MNDDTISRAAVIKAVDRHTFDTDNGLCLDDDITVILEEVPSAQTDVTDINVGDTISRRAAVEALYDWEMCYDWDEHCREEDPKPAYIVSPSDVIEKLPSAQPEIIRCRDCKKYDMHDHRCKHWNHGVVVMDWCSKAERRQA